MKFDEVLKEPSEYDVLREKVDRFLEEISELKNSGGTGTQEGVCGYLLRYAEVIGLGQ